MSESVVQRDTTMDAGGVDHAQVARRARGWGWWFVAEHRIRAMRSYVASWVAIGIGSPFLFLMGLGLGLGLLVDANQGEQGVDGVPYLVFIAPALSMATAMQTAAQENTYGVFGGFKWFPMFFAMNGTPISPAHIVLRLPGVGARASAAAARGVLRRDGGLRHRRPARRAAAGRRSDCCSALRPASR